MENKTIVDITSFNPQFKDGLVFTIYEGLKEGKEFELVDENDLFALQQQFEELNVKEYHWQYLERGPQYWRAKIVKNKPKSDCCCKHNHG